MTAPASEPNGPELSIVLPVYNEGDAVEPVLRALSAGVMTAHELVVVYDFDGDTTVPVVERLTAEIPGLRGLRNDLGRGVLNAMKAGIAGTTAPYVLISMADGSDEPHIVDLMVGLARDGADVVAASRYMPGGHQVGGPRLKRLMSRMAGLTLHWFARVSTHDPTNNFKLYSRRFLDSVTIESRAGFELALELTVKATLDGRRVAEVPTTWRDRTAGQSNFKLRKWLPQYLRWYAVAFRGRWVATGSGRTGMIGRLRMALERIGLPAWFVVIDLLWIAKLEALGIDARHYQRAATEWLAGGNPWAIAENGIPYASGPHTLLFYASTSLLPLPVSVALWMVLGIAASVWLVRRLGLPMWWLLFPPFAHAMWNGNPQSIALALLVVGGPVAASVAVGLKLYAGIPLIARWRDLVVAGVVLAVTLPLVPWQAYFEQGLGVASHLQTAWNGSAWRLPILIPPTLVALWLLRRHGAEWFAVPAVFPATQFYYVAMALPALVGRPVLAAALALPMVLMVPLAVIVLAGWTFLDSRSRGRTGRPLGDPIVSH